MKSFDSSLSTDRDWVRLAIGDLPATDCYFEDATIDAVLSQQANKWLAAAELGDSLLVSWTTTGKGVVEKRVDSLAIVRQGARGNQSNAESDYRDLLKRLRETGATMVRSKGRRFVELL